MNRMSAMMNLKDTEKARILIVEDNPTNARMLAQALVSEYKVSIASTGIEALEISLSEKSRPHLILLDIMLPGLNGHQVCSRLKSHKETQDIPVIFISSRDSDKDETQGLQLGAVDYITKPFSLPIVLARIRNHLELKWHRDYFEQLCHHDGLTGIPNRRRYDDILESEWRRSCRQETWLSIVMADIDEFKKYNDSYGHAAGDECLRQVSRIMSSKIRRAGDFVARYGGEEFAFILPNTDKEKAYEICSNIKKAVEELAMPHQFSEHKYITISMGIASAMISRQYTAQMLQTNADKALYRAKSEGRNKVVFYDSECQDMMCSQAPAQVLERLQSAVLRRELSADEWAILDQLLKVK